MSNTAAVLHGANDLRITERPQDPLPAGYAQVKIMATTLCGSDLHYYTHGRNGMFVVQKPLVLGHEAAGIVTAVGPGVSTIRPGMRVAIECGVPCRECPRCLENKYNLCLNMRFCSSAKTFPHLDGTLQTFLTHPADLLHPLPPNISFEQGALAEPLGVVIHASRRAGSVGGKGEPGAKGASVLVFGAGAVGLLACMLARAQGARRIVCVDVNEARLRFAKEQGFVDIVVNTSTPRERRPTSPLSPAQAMQEALDRSKRSAERILQSTGMAGTEGFDVIFECTGAEPCIQAGIYATRPGGKVMLVGMGSPNIVLPVASAATREVDLIGVFRYANTYPAALALLSSGALDGIEKMITHRVSLKETKYAFDILAKGVDDNGTLAVKVCVLGD